MISNTKLALVGVLGALASLKSVSAHGVVKRRVCEKPIIIDGNYYAGSDPSNPGGNLINPIILGDNTDHGFKDLTSEEVATNAPDGTNADIHAAVSAGSVIEWHWDQWPASHLGPISTFAARCPDTGCSGFDGNTATNWFKISEYGFEKGAWASAGLVADNNFGWQVTMPTDLESGYYLIRHDIIAMHSTDAPQGYPIVFWAYLTSSGTTVPTTVGSFPAMYATDDEALTWNIYDGSDQSLFVVPGIALYDPSIAGNSGPVAAGSTAPTGTPITTDAGPDGAASAPAASSSGASAPSASASVSSASASASSASASASSASASATASTIATPAESEAADPTVTSAISDVASASAPAITAASAATSAGSDVCDDEIVYVTVTVPAGSQTSAGAALALSSGAVASSARPAPTGTRSRVANASGRHRGGSAAASAPASTVAPAAAALATSTPACECPTTRKFIERDASPLIEEVYTRSGPKFLTRGLVFASEFDARAACGTECEVLSASKRKVESRWTRALF